MAGENSVTLFGFEIRRAGNQSPNNTPTFVPPQNDDGAINITSAAHYGTYVDLDGSSAKNDVELITRYREMSTQPELETAIDDIVNEAIVKDDDGTSIRINLDHCKEISKDVKTKIEDEFQNVLRLLNYNKAGHDLFRRWYVDGRMNYNIILDRDNTALGIQELRYIDPRKLKKVRELTKQVDANTNAEVIKVTNEFYVYQDKVQSAGPSGSNGIPGVRIAKDSIINITSGLMDARHATVLSYLHKAIKPLNQLRMVEDATVIYRISRAPERRIFYVDVGELPKMKAEQYMNDIMTKYRNKLVYDSQTGQVQDDRKNMSMLEDIWIPRRGGNKATEIDTLSGGENLGVMEDVIYFEKKLYKALSVPVARLNPSDGFSLGRDTEITRDELKFMKFIDRLRSRFSDLFDQALKVQLIAKNICNIEEWEEWRENIHYDYVRDNYFTELKEAEIMKERLALVSLIDPYTGRYYSEEWVRKHVLQMTDDDIKEMEKQIKKEGLEDPMSPQNTDQTNPNNTEASDMAQPGTNPPKPLTQRFAQEIIDPEDHGVNATVRRFSL